MKKVSIVVACLAIAGCSAGTDDDSEGSNQSQALLVGKWWLDGDICNLGTVFWKDGRYEVDLICDLDDGSLGIEAEAGSYTASDNIVDFTPEVASCFLEDRDYNPYSMSYTVERDVLRFVTPGGAVILERLTSDPDSLGGGAASGGVSATYGCAEDDGFYDGEIQPVN